jgi:hypothetical protein
MIARIAYAILAGVIAFIIMVVLGSVTHMDVFTRFAVLVAVLVAAIYFFARPTPPAL